jgi:N-acetylmuramoyl-L-alanine amidase
MFPDVWYDGVMSTALLTRLAVVYDDTPAQQVMAGSADWRNGANPAAGTASFGAVINAVRSVVVHQTAGWPSRNKAQSFVRRFITRNAMDGTKDVWGIGPQYYLSSDGSVFRLIDMPRVALHGTFTNGWSIGVETGNGATAIPPSGGNRWHALSSDAEDIPGAKVYVRDHRDNPREVIVCWWTTAGYSGPARAPVGDDDMLFTEWHYRTWALLGRYLSESLLLPRNLPVLPHAKRSDNLRTSTAFRRILLADERFSMLVRELSAFNIQEVDFEPANAATLETRYDAAVQAATSKLKQHNRAWRKIFDVYRGFHGHGFSGAIGRTQHDHDCPGPVFDWHRFARELWDWWWHPFDVDDAVTTTAVPRRVYRNPNGDTPLVEHYFDENEPARILRITNGIHGPQSSPLTFRLEQGSPVYALANGELVAARFPAPGDQVSMAFVLVRHEVFHKPNPWNAIMTSLGIPAPAPGRIDYDGEPDTIYSLYMHLGRPAGMSFEDIVADNPDWLNRLLIRKKECDLGVPFYDNHATHHGIPDAAWNSRPPGSGMRLTALESWRVDQVGLDGFLGALGRGDIALAPLKSNLATPIRVILGDFLGEAGVIQRQGTTSVHGIRVETFASGMVPTGFSSTMGAPRWNPPSTLSGPPAVFYRSEWAEVPSASEAQELAALGVDVDLVTWWPTVAMWTQLDGTLSASARLIPEGWAFHFRPLDVMRWLNAVTWESEWSKYQVKDASGNPVARPARPRSQRV